LKIRIKPRARRRCADVHDPRPVSPKAERDLDEHGGHIAADNPEAAERVRQIFLNTADFLALHPELGMRFRNAAPRHAQIRWFVVPKFRNYLIFIRRFRKQSWSFAFFTRRRIGHDSFPLRHAVPRKLAQTAPTADGGHRVLNPFVVLGQCEKSRPDVCRECVCVRD